MVGTILHYTHRRHDGIDVMWYGVFVYMVWMVFRRIPFCKIPFRRNLFRRIPIGRIPFCRILFHRILFSPKHVFIPLKHSVNIQAQCQYSIIEGVNLLSKEFTHPQRGLKSSSEIRLSLVTRTVWDERLSNWANKPNKLCVRNWTTEFPSVWVNNYV